MKTIMELTCNSRYTTTMEPVTEGSTGATWWLVTHRDSRKAPYDLVYKCKFDTKASARRKYNELREGVSNEN